MDNYWIWFSRIFKIGARTQKDLLEKYDTPQKIWELDRKELERYSNLTEEQIKIILDNTYRENLKLYSAYMEKKNIKMITIKDEEYPKKLLNIYDPPSVIYVLGNEKILNNTALAIIGSRKCSEYGKIIAKQFAYNLSKQNINIISGLAKGIDTYAHLWTNCAQKMTIAIIGSGLDIIYPQENEKLAKDIVENGGAIVSEYIVGTRPEKSFFPARNRIISGLSDGVLVVEANQKSGTFITVDFALEQGKNVYAIPR